MRKTAETESRCDSLPLSIRLIVLIVVLMIYLVGCGGKTSRKWSKGEIVVASVGTGLAVWNCVESEKMLDRGGRELSPLMGEYPSDLRLVGTMALTHLVMLGIGHRWPTVELPVVGECELRMSLIVGKGVVNGGLAIGDREVER